MTEVRVLRCSHNTDQNISTHPSTSSTNISVRRETYLLLEWRAQSVVTSYKTYSLVYSLHITIANTGDLNMQWGTQRMRGRKYANQHTRLRASQHTRLRARKKERKGEKQKLIGRKTKAGGREEVPRKTKHWIKNKAARRNRILSEQTSKPGWNGRRNQSRRHRVHRHVALVTMELPLASP